MTGGDFIRRVGKLGRKRGIHVRFESRKGKGSHGRIYYGDVLQQSKTAEKKLGRGSLLQCLHNLACPLRISEN